MESSCFASDGKFFRGSLFVWLCVVRVVGLWFVLLAAVRALAVGFVGCVVLRVWIFAILLDVVVYCVDGELIFCGCICGKCEGGERDEYSASKTYEVVVSRVMECACLSMFVL